MNGSHTEVTGSVLSSVALATASKPMESLLREQAEQQQSPVAPPGGLTALRPC